MANKYTKTIHKSYGKRIGESFKGIGTGIVLIILGIWALVWNEGRSVKRIKELNRGEKDVVSIDCATINPANDNRLVHFYGRAVTSAVLNDEQFALSITNELRFIRHTEMYQWREESKEEKKQNVGGSEDTVITYEYKKSWETQIVDSSRFEQQEGHANPTGFRYPSKTIVADNVKIGAFRIPRDNVARIGNPIAMTFGVSTNRVIPAGIPTNAVATETGWYIPGPGNGTPTMPQIGDERVSFSHVPQNDASFIAVQLGDSFAKSTPKYGPVMQMDGICTTEEMFTDARNANSFFTWIIRLLGFIMIFGGFKAVLEPIKTIADVLPFLGKIIGFGTKFVAFVVALAISLLTIAISWLAYRPLISIPLLVIAGALVFFLVRKAKASAK